MTLLHSPHIAHKIEDLDVDVHIPMIVRCPTHGTEAHLQVLTHIGDRSTSRVSACSLVEQVEGAVACSGPCISHEHEPEPNQDTDHSHE